MVDNDFKQYVMRFIEAHGLTKVYGTGDNAFYALNDVSFCIDKGCFIAVTGASGSGKSTLLYMPGGIDRPISRRIILDGTDIFEEDEDDFAYIRWVPFSLPLSIEAAQKNFDHRGFHDPGSIHGHIGGSDRQFAAKYADRCLDILIGINQNRIYFHAF